MWTTSNPHIFLNTHFFLSRKFVFESHTNNNYSIRYNEQRLYSAVLLLFLLLLVCTMESSSTPSDPINKNPQSFSALSEFAHISYNLFQSTKCLSNNFTTNPSDRVDLKTSWWLALWFKSSFQRISDSMTRTESCQCFHGNASLLPTLQHS